VSDHPEVIGAIAPAAREEGMSTVLLGWELGDGLGHVANLLEIAHELAAHGHSPVLVVKDFAVARAFLGGAPFPVLQAPVWLKPVPLPFRAASFADILAIRGYADADGLLLLLNAWQALIDLTKASLVICDFAPSLCLAAHGVLPTVVIGSGFAVPPSIGREFPRLGPGCGNMVGSDRILEVVHDVQGRRRLPAPATLPALMATPARFVHTFSELDTYRATRTDAVVEPMRPLGPPLAPAPPDTFFAYLNAEYPGVELILPRLATAGFHGSAYVRHAPAPLVDAARRAGIKVFDKPVPLKEALAQAAVIVHHGSLNTAQTAAAAGRPQLALPSNLENTLITRALEQLGVARSLEGHFPVQAVSQLLREVSAPEGCGRQAHAFAQTIEARNYQGCLAKIVDSVQAFRA
jgi:rhamnosyltransferase subunit B